MQFTDENFESDVLKSDVPVLVDFFADWCGPCKMQSPIIEELAKEMEDKPVKIGKIDVDKNPKTAEKYNVMSIPTLIIFKDGQAAETMTGLQGKEILVGKLKKIVG